MAGTISHSEVESWLLCERKHYYGYGLEIEHIKSSDALIRGTLGHEMMAAYYQTILDGGTNAAAYAAARNHLLSLMDATNAHLVNELGAILNFHKQALPLKDYEILAVEKEFILPLGSGDDASTMPIVVDLIVRDTAGKIVVVDHKFVYDFMRDSTMELLPQIPKYIAALKVLGYPVDYGMYHQLRYRKMKDPPPEKIIQLAKPPMNLDRIKRTFEEQMVVTDRILQRRALPLEEQSAQAMRTANKMVCDTCSFSSLCSAELSNNRPDLVIRAEYKKRERRGFDSEIEEVA